MPPSLAEYAPSGKTTENTVECSQPKRYISNFKSIYGLEFNNVFTSSKCDLSKYNKLKEKCKQKDLRKFSYIKNRIMSNIGSFFVNVVNNNAIKLSLLIMLAFQFLPSSYGTPVSKGKSHLEGVKIYENVNGKFVEGDIMDKRIHLSAEVLLNNKFNPEIELKNTLHKVSKGISRPKPAKTMKNIKKFKKNFKNTRNSKIGFINNVDNKLNNSRVTARRQNINKLINELEYDSNFNSSKKISNNDTNVYDDKIIINIDAGDEILDLHNGFINTMETPKTIKLKLKNSNEQSQRNKRDVNRKSGNRKHRNTDIYGDLKSDDVHADKSNKDTVDVSNSRSSYRVEHAHEFDSKDRKETSAHFDGSSVSGGSSTGAKESVGFGSQIRSQTSDREPVAAHGIGSESSKRVTRIVQSRYGRLQGFVVQPTGTYAKRLQPVQVFLGVPYATPPVNNNRFSPTRAPSPWPGLLLAQKHAPVCPQRLPDISNFTASLQQMPRGRYDYLKRLLPYLQNQSEDCLYLNVYAPANEPTGPHKYPVLVFIHGESYEWNSGNPYDGSVLAAYADLVVVTLNYRLGILGFLNANPSPGRRARVANYGLMDQIAALHWIQQNVALFGGDPESVTLMGHGTGAACIHFLMASPAVVPGLFHRAVLMSGSALAAWALVQRPVEYALKLARQVNCTPPTDMSREHESIVDCLREVPLATLLSAQVEPPKYLSAFGPSVDGVVIRSDFARDLLRRPSGFSGQGSGAGSNLDYSSASDWAGQLRSGGGSGISADGSNKGQDRLGPVPHGQNKYDLLFGVVTSESLMRFSATDVQSGFEGNRRDRILRTYVRNAYTRHLSEIFYTVANEYTDWERTVQHPINTRDATVAALSDAQFVAPLVQTADLMISSRTHIVSSNSGSKSESSKDQNGQHGENDDGSMKAYFYVFDYQTKDGDYPQRMGSVHGEELAYVFGAPLVDGFSHFPRNYTKSELALSEAVLIYWANFARTGNPNENRKQEQILPVSRERNRFRSIVWEQYDPVHQKYLEIGMKPRLKNHFRAHQLSVWLRLVPELHRSGNEDAGTRHNLFRCVYFV